MKKASLGLALLAALALYSTAQAADAALTVGIGTLGYAAHVSVPLSESWNARIGYNGVTIHHDENTDGVDYRFRAKSAFVDALVDYFPFQGAFRLSTGLVYNGLTFDGSGQPTGNGTYTLNGHTYAGSTFGSLNAALEYRKVAPYLGIGFGNAVAKDKGWGFSGDLGVLFMGAPKTSVTNQGCKASASVCAQIASDMPAETASLHDAMKDANYLPVLRVGVSYKF